jgi:putative ABC transport system ATP-binding protein
MIQVKKLLKFYRTEEIETCALNEVDMEIKAGEFVAIMGPSGCGKSTLLNILGLIDQLDGGQYYFLGEEVSKYNENKRAIFRKDNIGFVFQSFNLIDELTVYENIELPLIYANISTNDRKNKVHKVLEKLNLIPRINHFPQQLSGGQQQRVAVARAIVNHPKLILADEPTGNLDTQNGEDVMKILTSLNEEGTTVVMVTHSPEHAEYSQRIIRLLDGKIISENKLVYPKQVI